jgi:hypothetical protein
MWHNKAKPPEPPHFLAADGAIMLSPGTWYYRIGPEVFNMEPPASAERCAQIRYYKVTDGRPTNWRRNHNEHPTYPRYCVNKGRLSFIKNWSILTWNTVLIDKDGKEIGDAPDWCGHHYEQKRVDLPEDQWTTSWEQGLSPEMYQKLYGPLKILV